MMTMVSIIAFVVLTAYLVGTACRFGLPAMVSDTFYQWEGWRRHWGLLFTLTMVGVGMMMMVALLDTGKGAQPLAFMGCAGLMLVGMAPNYCDKDTYPVHKGGAVVAALGCVGWSMSVTWWVTFAVVAVYALYLGVMWLYGLLDSLWYMSRRRDCFHPWYWAEVAGFVDVWVTYFLVE